MNLDNNRYYIEHDLTIESKKDIVIIVKQGNG